MQSIAIKALRALDQRGGSHSLAPGIVARADHPTRDANTVRVAVANGIGNDHIALGGPEGLKLLRNYVCDAKLGFAHAKYQNLPTVASFGESARVLDCVGHGFALAELKKPRALEFAHKVYAGFIDGNPYHVSVAQRGIGLRRPVNE